MYVPCVQPLESRVLLSLVPTGDPLRLYQDLPEPTSVANSDIAMDADGDFAIVSELALPREPGGRDLNYPRIQLFAQQGQPVGEMLYPDERGYGGRAPQIAMSRTGDFAVAWWGWGEDPSPPNPYVIRARAYHSDGTPRGPSFDVTAGTLLSATRDFGLAMNWKGQFVVAWRDALQGVCARLFDTSGAPLGGGVTVPSSSWNPTRDGVDVAIDDDADFVVSWRQGPDDFNGPSIRTRRFHANGVADFHESVVVAGTSGTGDRTHVVSDGAGNYTVAWEAEESSSGRSQTRGVRARRYTAGEIPRGPVFDVVPQSAAGTSGLDVAIETDGDTTFAWRVDDSLYYRQYTAAGQPFDKVLAMGGLPPDAAHVAVRAGGSRGFVYSLQGIELTPDGRRGVMAGRWLQWVAGPDPGPVPDPGPGPDPDPNTNQAPTTTGIGDVAVDQDAPDTVIPLFPSFADVEDGDAAMHYQVVGNTNVGLFSAVTIDGVSGLLTLDYAPGASGVATLTVKATDTPGASVQTSFNVTVRPAAPAPGPGPDPGPTPQPAPGPVPNPNPVGSPPTALGNGSFAGELVSKAKKRRPAGLGGVLVFIDSNLNGTFDAGELSATTDAAGSYAFTGLAAGKYRVRANVPAGYEILGARRDGGLRNVLVRAKQRKPAKVKPLMMKPPA